MNCLANSIDSLNKLLEIDGQKFSTSKHINDEVCLCFIFSNHVITEEVSFDWFILVPESMVELILSNNNLLIFPVLFFEGFNNLHDTRWGNPLCGLLFQFLAFYRLYNQLIVF